MPPISSHDDALLHFKRFQGGDFRKIEGLIADPDDLIVPKSPTAQSFYGRKIQGLCKELSILKAGYKSQYLHVRYLKQSETP